MERSRCWKTCSRSRLVLLAPVAAQAAFTQCTATALTGPRAWPLPRRAPIPARVRATGSMPDSSAIRAASASRSRPTRARRSRRPSSIGAGKRREISAPRRDGQERSPRPGASAAGRLQRRFRHQPRQRPRQGELGQPRTSRPSDQSQPDHADRQRRLHRLSVGPPRASPCWRARTEQDLRGTQFRSARAGERDRRHRAGQPRHRVGNEGDTRRARSGSRSAPTAARRSRHRT